MAEGKATEMFHIGQEFWIPCEVHPGPFPGERRVYLKLGEDEWYGFVDATEVREDATPPRARVRVIRLGDHSVALAIRGHSPGSRGIETRRELLRDYGAVAT